MMIFGALTAVIVIVTQLFLYEAPQGKLNSSVKTEKTSDENSGDKVLLSAPQPSVLSSFHANLSHEAVFLFEIILDVKEHKAWAPETPVSLGKYFITLFRAIISPNAP
jgi:hypothetical protein